MYLFHFKLQDDTYFRLFSASVRLVQRSAYVLKDALTFHDQIQKSMEAIAGLEQQADDLNDAIIDRLNQIFITPFDREDIFLLATLLDDVVDSFEGVVERMMLYSIGKPSAGLLELTRFLAVCTDELVKAFDLLENIKDNQHKILDHARKVVVLESEGDRIYRQEIACLFTQYPDPVEIIKRKEILENLEFSMNLCEKVADRIRSVVMKYA